MDGTSISLASFARLGAHQMGRFRPLADLKAAHDLLEQTIGLRHALVLSKMLEPGVCQKGLDEAAVLRGVLKYSPVISAVSTPFACALAARACRNGSRFFGSMRYSTVTRTGPRSPRTRKGGHPAPAVP